MIFTSLLEIDQQPREATVKQLVDTLTCWIQMYLPLLHKYKHVKKQKPINLCIYNLPNFVEEVINICKVSYGQAQGESVLAFTQYFNLD